MTYRVVTESGAVYDIDGWSMTRTAPSDGPLRRDGETVKLIEMIELEVGKPMVVKIDLNWPGVPWTIRTTTPVVEIEDL